MSDRSLPSPLPSSSFPRLLALAVTISLAALGLVAVPSLHADPNAPSPRDRQLAEESFKAGLQMRDNGALGPAIDLFYKALSLHKDKRYYVALGGALRDSERKTLAFIAYRNALDAIEAAAAAASPTAASPGSAAQAHDDPDYQGLVVELVSMGLDLGKFDDVETRLPALEAFDPSLARSARNRLWIEQGKRALAAQRFPQAYRFFALARKDTDDDRPGRRGCIQALNGLADRLETEGRFVKALDVLLRLNRLDPSEGVAARIQGAFIRAGKPADLAVRVKAAVAATGPGAKPADAPKKRQH